MRLLRSVAIAAMIVGGVSLLVQAVNWFILLAPVYQNVIEAIVGFVAMVALIYVVTSHDIYGGSN